MRGPNPSETGDAPEYLVQRAVAGDRRSLDELLGYVHPLVVRYCRARLSPSHRALASADDVAQDVCMALIGALPSYSNQGRPFLAFVFGIAAHKVADTHRASQRSRTHPVAEVPDVPSGEDDPEEIAVLGSVSQTVGELLATLPEAQREILRLRVVVGLTADETAAALSMTPVAVRVAQHRALTRLRDLMGEPARLDRPG